MSNLTSSITKCGQKCGCFDKDPNLVLLPKNVRIDTWGQPQHGKWLCSLLHRPIQALVKVILGLDNGKVVLGKIIAEAGFDDGTDLLQTNVRYKDEDTMRVCKVSWNLLPLCITSDMWALVGSWCNSWWCLDTFGSSLLGRYSRERLFQHAPVSWTFFLWIRSEFRQPASES